MPYQTGTVNDFVELKTAIESFLVTQGFTQEGNILKKAGIYALLTATTTSIIKLEGGKSSTGGGALVDKHDGPVNAWINNAGAMHGNYRTVVISWPVTYTFQYWPDPDEFWVFISYNNGFYQHMGFGNIVKAAPFTGGAFYSSQAEASSPGAGGSMNISAAGAYLEAIPFQGRYNAGSGYPNEFSGSVLHAEIDGLSWFGSFPIHNPSPGFMIEGRWMYEERDRSENIWNNNATPVPIRLYGRVTNGNLQYLGYINNLRFSRIKNINPGQVISDGTDNWKFYPPFAKNAATPNPGSALHSGTYGLAVRYDGPL